MPVMRCTENGKPGYKWGKEGNACFTYTGGDASSRERAKKKAEEQGRAIEASKRS